MVLSRVHINDFLDNGATLIRDIEMTAKAYSKIDGAPEYFVSTVLKTAFNDTDEFNYVLGPTYISREGAEAVQKFVLAAKDREVVKAVTNSENPEACAKFAFEAISSTTEKEVVLKALEVREFFETEIKSYDASIGDLIKITTKNVGADVGMGAADEPGFKAVSGAEGFIKLIREGASFETMLLTILEKSKMADDNGEKVMVALQGVDNYTPRAAAIYLAYIYDAAVGPAGIGLILNTGKIGNPFAEGSFSLVASKEFANFTNRFKSPNERPEEEIRRLAAAFRWGFSVESQARGENADQQLEGVKNLVGDCKEKEMYNEILNMDVQNLLNIFNTPGINGKQIKRREDLLRAATLARLVRYEVSQDFDLLSNEEYKKLKNPRKDRAYTLSIDPFLGNKAGYVASNSATEELIAKVNALPRDAQTQTYEDLARSYIAKRYGVSKSAGLTLDGLYAFSCMDHRRRIALAESLAK